MENRVGTAKLDTLLTVGDKESLRQRIKSQAVATAKRVLPQSVIDEIQRYRTCSGSERHLYLKLRILNTLGLGIRKPRVPQVCHSILFVCFGNIIRSPMCEALLTRELENLQLNAFAVSSAGLNAVPGRAAHPWAVTAARELGISLEQHRARALTDQMVNQAEVIFAMDLQNYVQLVSRWPKIGKKVFMLGACAQGSHTASEIADPFYMSLEQTRACYRILNSCIQNFARSPFFEEQPHTMTRSSGTNRQ